MRVCPVVKYQKLKVNELRVINIGKDAIAELLWEHLMECQEEYFHVSISDSSYTCMMHWDSENEILTYATARIAETAGKIIDYNKIFNKIGFTTSTLFSKERFASVKLDEYIID